MRRMSCREMTDAIICTMIYQVGETMDLMDRFLWQCVIHPPVNMNIMEMSAIRTEDLCNGLFPLTQRL